MGMDQKVVLAPERMPSWPSLVELLARVNVTLQMRMIDGELSFPEDLPPETWRELRVGVKSGMITIRRDPDGVTLVVWGNADAELRQAWNALAWAFAQASGGSVGTQSADQFKASAGLPT